MALRSSRGRERKIDGEGDGGCGGDVFWGVVEDVLGCSELVVLGDGLRFSAVSDAVICCVQLRCRVVAQEK